MADELEIVTENAASDSWVDDVPGAVSTGYQAQNTNIDARSSGDDKSYVYISTNDVKVAISGYIDVDGLPFLTKSIVTLTPATVGIATANTYYIRIVAGSDDQHKSLELVSTAPSWSATKNAYYSGAYRYLSWIIAWGENTRTATKLLPPIAAYGMNDGKYSVVPKYILQHPFKFRIKRKLEFAGAGAWSNLDRICINHVSGQIIRYDNSADTYYVYNPNHTLSTSFARNAANITAKPDAIFWSRYKNCLASYSDSAGYIWFHDGYTSNLLAGTTVNVGTGYNWTDVVSHSVVGAVEYIIGSQMSGGAAVLDIVSITGTTPALVQNNTDLDTGGESIAWNYDLNILITSDDTSNILQVADFTYFNATDLYQASTIEYVGNVPRIQRPTYNPVTGGYYALYKTANTYEYLVELGI